MGMIKIPVGKNLCWLMLHSLLVLATLSVQNNSVIAACWDCDKIEARGSAEGEPSLVQQPAGYSPSDSAVSSNALDSLFRDPPQDTFVPPKKNNSSKNNQVNNNNNQTNKQSTSSSNPGAQDMQPPPPGRWSGIDTLVAIFFAVAAVWLIAATIYSITLLVLIRLQARGELDIYDEDLGRLTFCNGRFSLHFGCILRRYAIQLERDYQRRLQQRYGNPNGDEENPQEPAPIRIMTREERRQAVERLLGIQPTKLEHNNNSDKYIHPHAHEANDEKDKNVAGPASPSHSVGSSQDGPVCSICLDGYAAIDVVFKSTKCAHMFHKDCLMEWLERRNNTECPCCRDPLVSDEEVWETVKKMRKERRRQLGKENGCSHRFIQWMLARRHRRHLATVENRNSTTSVGSTSSEEDTSNSPRSTQSENEEGTADQFSRPSQEVAQGDEGDAPPSIPEESDEQNNASPGSV